MTNPYNQKSSSATFWRRIQSRASPNLSSPYVAVSGPSCAGKSTIIYLLERSLAKARFSCKVINSAVFHHPLMVGLFECPEAFAFPIQLNFAIQRNLALRAWTRSGGCLISERSHLDDLVFFRSHRHLGHISDEQYHAYMTLRAYLHSSIPRPSIYVYLDIDEDVSISRLRVAQRRGERPIEASANEAALIGFIRATTREYRRHAELYSKELGDRFVRYGADSDPCQVAYDVAERMK